MTPTHTYTLLSRTIRRKAIGLFRLKKIYPMNFVVEPHLAVPVHILVFCRDSALKGSLQCFLPRILLVKLKVLYFSPKCPFLSSTCRYAQLLLLQISFLQIRFSTCQTYWWPSSHYHAWGLWQSWPDTSLYIFTYLLSQCSPYTDTHMLKFI